MIHPNIFLISLISFSYSYYLLMILLLFPLFLTIFNCSSLYIPNFLNFFPLLFKQRKIVSIRAFPFKAFLNFHKCKLLELVPFQHILDIPTSFSLISPIVFIHPYKSLISNILVPQGLRRKIFFSRKLVFS